MAMMLLLALGATLILVTSSETAISANFKTGGEALYAASAVVERTIAELRDAGDWSLVLNGTIGGAFTDGPPNGVRRLSDGSTVDLAATLNLSSCGRRTAC